MTRRGPFTGGYPIEIKHEFDFPLTVGGIVKQIRTELNEKLPQWQREVAADPKQFSEVEQAILAWSRGPAQWVTTAVLHATSVQRSVEESGEAIRHRFRRPLRKVGTRRHKLRLLCGLVVTLACTYCVPRHSRKDRASRKRGKEGVGLYLEQAALGIHEGISPSLRSEVARLGALLPSNQLTQRELARHGVDLNEKIVRSILLSTGIMALTARREGLEQWRSGQMEPQETLRDKRVVVAIDGGRARIREPKKGRKTKKGRQRFATPWREPKLMTIYIINKEGKMDPAFPSVVDGTFESADHLMELVAFHLFRLGAKQSTLVVFAGDGIDWIWDRVGMVAHRVGLKSSQWIPVVDLYHVIEQVNKVLEVIPKWDTKVRKRERSKIKAWLLRSQPERVLAYLKRLRQKYPRHSKIICGRIEYIRKRRPMMRYRQLRRRRLPIGSGAIESMIRRVVNLRIKSPSIFWKIENAEAMVLLRANALSGRWDELMKQLRQRTTRSRDWKWGATPLSCKDPQNAELAKEQRLAIMKT